MPNVQSKTVRPLTLLQEAFVEAYMANGGNARKAALSAGYSESVAMNTGAKMLTNASIKHAIAKRRAKLRKDNELSRDWVVKRLMAIADASPGMIIQMLKDNNWDLAVLTDEELALLDGLDMKSIRARDGSGDTVIDVKIKPGGIAANRIAALNSLARIAGINQDKVDVEVSMADKILAGRKRARIALKPNQIEDAE